MDCIPYINDLQLEINTLRDLKKDCKNDKIKQNQIDNKINNKMFLIEQCKENLSKLSNKNIEYKLYLKMLEGLNPSNAISQVAEENYMAEVTIWKYYYPNLKKILNV